MNTEMILTMLTFLQFVSLSIAFLERHEIARQYKEIPKRLFISRMFMLFLPTFILISLIIRPLGV